MSDTVSNETPEQTIGRIYKFIMYEGVAKTGLMMSRGGTKRRLMMSRGGPKRGLMMSRGVPRGN